MDTEIIKIILAFMVLINPFGALSLFMSLTHGHNMAYRRRVARIASITVLVTITFFTLAGEVLLKGLGISVGSFQVAGGILVFLIAINMMNGDGNPVKPSEDNLTSDKVSMSNATTASAVVPLAIPMIIGPGGISTVIIYSSKVTSWAQTSMILISAVLISIICYVSLMASAQVGKFLGNTGLNILSRIMGMLLAAVAIEIVVSGLRTIFPQLAG